MISDDLSLLLPEIVLAVFAMAALMFGVYSGKDRAMPVITWATAGVFLVLAFWIGVTGPGTHTAFGGMFIDDGFARFAKVVVLLSAAAVLVMSQDYMAKRGLGRFEYPVLIALAVVGMMVMISAGDLMSLYMGLELQSLALYVVAALRRDSLKSTEAGLKYFVLGALSSGLLLYGASLTYGYSGTTLFSGIIQTVHAGQMPLGLLIGLVFLISGMAFKISAVPFHMWTPDVYEGSPTPVTAFFATAPKVAAMALMARLLFGAFGTATQEWSQVLAVLAVASMFLGAVAALGQNDLKRLMAYSSITHMGYALVGLSAGTAEGVQAMLIYMSIYATTTIGVFAFMLSMERDGHQITDLRALNLFANKEPMKALALMVLLFSLAGVPPMLGFIGKFYVLKAAIDAHMYWLALLAVIASVIGAVYYIRIVYLMYFGKENEGLDTGPMGVMPWVMLMGSAAITLLGIINLFGVEGLAQAAAMSLVQ